MERKQLTIDDHKDMAEHLYAIEAHLKAIRNILGGSPNAEILDMICDCGSVIRPLGKFKMKLENQMLKRLGSEDSLRGSEGLNVYHACIKVKCDINLRLDTEKAHGQGEKIWWDIV
jgi:hypothetical protein